MIYKIRWRMFALVPLFAMSLYGADIGNAKDEKEYEKMLKYVESYRVKEKDIAKTIEKYGDIVDCVYLDKQPGMLREGMKNHVINKQPSFDIPVFDASVLPQKSIDIADSAFRVDCPADTVPIKRLNIEDIKRHKTLEHFFSKYGMEEGGIAPQVYGSGNGHEYATVNKSIINYGSGSFLNLWKPSVEESSEMTLSQIWVSGGSGSSLQSVEAGWQVYPNKYGDNHAHFFIYFTNMGYSDTNVDYGRCYNLDCYGFIQTNNNLAIGIGLPFSESSYSQTNGQQLGFIVRWQRDQSTGHWWLIYGSTAVGYYPTNLFDSDGIKYYSNRIDYGGEIYNNNTGGQHTQTDMGSGAFAAQGYGKAAYQTGAQYLNTSYVWTHLINPSQFVDNSNCYSLAYTQGTSLWGTYFYFGGPGYNTNCQ